MTRCRSTCCLSRSRAAGLRASAWATLGLAVAGCAAPGSRGVTPPPASASDAADPAAISNALVAAHNRARAQAGLPPLDVSPVLTAVAQAHADDMAARRRMSHRGSDGSSPFRRMERAGYRFARAAENVAYGQRSVGEVMAAWTGSAGHRRNLLGRFTEIGAAAATDGSGTRAWCVTFGTPAAE
jgi:uncharacterized protein YkwD